MNKYLVHCAGYMNMVNRFILILIRLLLQVILQAETWLLLFQVSFITRIEYYMLIKIIVMAKDRGMGDAIKAQILMYPAVAADTGIYPSYKLYGNGDCYLSSKEAELCASAYIPSSLQGTDNIYITPMSATTDQLKGLPPALVLTCECDILRDEGEAYVSKLIGAGVDTVGMRVLGTIHSFMSISIPETPQYRTCITMVVDFLNGHLKL